MNFVTPHKICTLGIQSTLCIQIGTLCIQIGTHCIQISTLCIQIGTLCIQIGTFCVQIATLCIQIGKLCIKIMHSVKKLYTLYSNCVQSGTKLLPFKSKQTADSLLLVKM